MVIKARFLPFVKKDTAKENPVEAEVERSPSEQMQIILLSNLPHEEKAISIARMLVLNKELPPDEVTAEISTLRQRASIPKDTEFREDDWSFNRLLPTHSYYGRAIHLEWGDLDLVDWAALVLVQVADRIRDAILSELHAIDSRKFASPERAFPLAGGSLALTRPTHALLFLCALGIRDSKVAESVLGSLTTAYYPARASLTVATFVAQMSCKRKLTPDEYSHFRFNELLEYVDQGDMQTARKCLTSFESRLRRRSDTA